MSDKTSNKKANDSLLNCPFCGGEAELKYEKQNLPFAEERNSFVVTCKDCGCSTSYFSEMNIYYSKDYKEKEKELKDKAIKAWNNRKPMERIVERLKNKINPLHNVNWNAAMEEAIEIVKEEGGV